MAEGPEAQLVEKLRRIEALHAAELEGERAPDAGRGAGDDGDAAHDRRSISVAFASPPPSHMVCRP